MPKVRKLGCRPDPRETAVLSEIGGGMAALKITQGELARRAGINRQTMSNRMRNIGEMRLSELWAIRKVFEQGGIK